MTCEELVNFIKQNCHRHTTVFMEQFDFESDDRTESRAERCYVDDETKRFIISDYDPDDEPDDDDDEELDERDSLDLN